MKKSDIAMIILIASVSAMIAFFIGNQLSFLKPDPKGVAVPTAEAIVSDVPEAGDQFKVFKEEKQARSVADSRMQDKIESERKKEDSSNELSIPLVTIQN